MVLIIVWSNLIIMSFDKIKALDGKYLIGGNIMKKSFLSIAICLVMALVTIVGTSIPAFASGNDTLIYGGVKDILEDDSDHCFTFTTSNTTPYKTAASDLRTHRIIFKVQAIIANNVDSATFRIGLKPEGSSTIYWSGYKTMNYWDTYVFTNNPAESSSPDYMNVNWPISPGQRFQVIFQTSNNVSITISQFDLYCD